MHISGLGITHHLLLSKMTEAEPRSPGYLLYANNMQIYEISIICKDQSL